MTTATVPSAWIVSRRFDLTWFFGGAGLGLLWALLVLVARLPVTPLVWLWIMAFDGPHMAAAYSRTYADPTCWKQHRRLLLGSCLMFLPGPLLLCAGVLFHSPAPFTAYLAICGLWAIHHTARQHYGFLALYKAKSGDRQDIVFERWCLYAGCWLPFAAFMLAHPHIRALGGLSPLLSPAEFVLLVALIGAWVATLGVFALRAARRWRPAHGQKIAYFFTTVMMYGLTYFFLSRFEPVFHGNGSPDQEFLLISMVLALFHSAQYVGLVWFHNRNRYATARTLSGALSRTPARYVLALLLFVPFYVAIAVAAAVYPSLAAPAAWALGPFTFNQVALSIWWGIGLHHYILDQRIWRVSGDTGLRQALRLS